MDRLIRSSFLASIFIFISGCVYPIDFESDIKVNASGQHSIRVEGTFYDFEHLLVVDVTQLRKLTPKQRSEFAGYAMSRRDKLLNETKKEGFEEISSAGQFTYKGIYKKTSPDLTKSLSHYYNVSRTKTGSYILSIPSIDKSALATLDRLDLVVNGVLRVSLPSSAVVINHNADSSPGLFSSAYYWKYKSSTKSPTIEFKLHK